LFYVYCVIIRKLFFYDIKPVEQEYEYKEYEQPDDATNVRLRNSKKHLRYSNQ